MGLVDSDTLPLNVSREMLQAHSSLKTIQKKLVRSLQVALLRTAVLCCRLPLQHVAVIGRQSAAPASALYLQQYDRLDSGHTGCHECVSAC